MELTHLFECHFSDGTVITQSPEDVSSIDPNKSAFYDVLQRIDEVEVFAICSAEHIYVVDLRDGHFEIDGVPFSAHDGNDHPENCKFRLIYFRRNWQTVILGQEGTIHEVQYHIGWQTTVDGKNIQRTIAVF